MDRGEFLSVLRQSLEGCIPMAEVESNLDFYRNYFDESSQTDQEIIEELGDPRLIARTIIDAYKASKGPMADFYTEQAQKEFRQEYSENYDDEVTGAHSGKRFSSSFRWFEKLAFLAVIAVVVIVLIMVLGFLIVYVLPIILLVFVIKVLVDYFDQK